MIIMGYNEKCPWCDALITEETATLEHLMSNHREEAMDKLFPRKTKEENDNKRNKEGHED